MNKLADNIFFPFRALFVPEEDRFGLTSLRNERFQIVAKYAKGRTLDVGCGRNNLFIKNFANKESIGIDVFGYEGVENVVPDLCNLPFDDESFYTVTLIAVGGHIPKHLRECEFREFARVLRGGGQLLMTEGEPITQTIGHKWRHFSYALIGKQDMDSERGMEEEEEYCMSTKEIEQYLNSNGLKLKERIKFMWGLNNLYVAEKSNEYKN